MDAAQVATVLIAAGSLLGVLLAYFKYKPGQRQKLGVEVAFGELNVAEGSVKLMQTAFHAEFARMEARLIRVDQELEADRAEFAQYRDDTEARIAELAAALRAEKAEKLSVKRENEQLKARVAGLEAEVRTLKERRG